MKQVIVVNESLNLPRGKLAAQVAHASVACVLGSDKENLQTWVNIGMPKVVLACGSEEEIVRIYEDAVLAELPVYVVKDAGKTVVASGTTTCVGIGPAIEAKINSITGHLKLVK